MPTERADAAAGIVLYDVLPAVSRHDYNGFSDGLERLQRTGFKAAEWEAQPPPVHTMRDLVFECGGTCAALSSMGPTVAVLGHDVQATAERLRAADPTLVIDFASPRACGLKVETCLGGSMDVMVTLGPASWDRDVLDALLRLKIRVVRFPFAKETPKIHATHHAEVRAAARRIGADVETLADLPGGKPRLDNEVPTPGPGGELRTHLPSRTSARVRRKHTSH